MNGLWILVIALSTIVILDWFAIFQMNKSMFVKMSLGSFNDFVKNINLALIDVNQEIVDNPEQLSIIVKDDDENEIVFLIYPKCLDNSNESKIV